MWGSGEPEKVSGQGRCIRIFTPGHSLGRDGGGGWTAFQAWGLWSHEAVIGCDVGVGVGVGGGSGDRKSQLRLKLDSASALGLRLLLALLPSPLWPP